jgi:hypothetical protein
LAVEVDPARPWHIAVVRVTQSPLIHTDGEVQVH